VTKAFTGRHIAAILAGFFAVVIAVNVTMAHLAGSTFGGALAENGYVASQDYNHWIAAASAQDKLGWSVKPSIVGGRLDLAVTGVHGAEAQVRLVHPLGRTSEQSLHMIEARAGHLLSAERLPPGRWEAHITLKSAGREARFIEKVRA
jgi:nitrogen fixation protein FixH